MGVVFYYKKSKKQCILLHYCHFLPLLAIKAWFSTVFSVWWNWMFTCKCIQDMNDSFSFKSCTCIFISVLTSFTILLAAHCLTIISMFLLQNDPRQLRCTFDHHDMMSLHSQLNDIYHIILWWYQWRQLPSFLMLILNNTLLSDVVPLPVSFVNNFIRFLSVFAKSPAWNKTDTTAVLLLNFCLYTPL